MSFVIMNSLTQEEISDRTDAEFEAVRDEVESKVVNVSVIVKSITEISKDERVRNYLYSHQGVHAAMLQNLKKLEEKHAEMMKAATSLQEVLVRIQSGLRE